MIKETKEKYLHASHEAMVWEASVAGRPLRDLVQEIQTLYQNDDRPWIIGFSGGKDSTVVLSLVYAALLLLNKSSKPKKRVYAVSSDTLVETPIVKDMVGSVFDKINIQAQNDRLPISGHQVYPKPDQTFWVNLLGRGYPAPTTRFRWCTERMKIDPVSNFILDKVAKFGEVIVVLGSRSQESASRAQVIAKHKIDGSSLGRHTSLPNAYTFMPIEDWTADDVWQYLLSAPSPWGGSNTQLFSMYKGSNQGECPLVIDKSTPSCGNSRFGCWTCTVVNKDKAIHGLIESGEGWMMPLLKIRNYLWHTTQPENLSKYRNPKRRTGKITFSSSTSITEDGRYERKHIPGPYWLKYRKRWLRRLLLIESRLRRSGHEIELIGRDELQAIRQHWLWDPNEPDWSDSLPAIYRSVYPDAPIDWVQNDAGAFTAEDEKELRRLGEKHNVRAEMIMKLLETELSMSGLARRRGLTNKLQDVLSKDWQSMEDVGPERSKLDLRSVYRQKLDEISERLEAISNDN